MGARAAPAVLSFVIASIAVLLAGCGSAQSTTSGGVPLASFASSFSVSSSSLSASSSASASIDLAAVARQYDAVITPVNAHLDQIRARLQSDGNTADAGNIDPLHHDFAEVASAIRTALTGVLRIGFPPSMSADITALVRTESTLEATCTQMSTASASMIATRLTNDFPREASDAHAAANVVRADLGLPLATP